MLHGCFETVRHRGARFLIDILAPYFHRVRFYPSPADTPVRFSLKVFVRSVGKVSRDLKAVKHNDRLLAQREAVDVWAPLYDQTVALFLTAIDGKGTELCEQR